MTGEPVNPKKCIKKFYVWKIGMQLFHKLKTDCKGRVTVGKFPAHQIKNKSSIHKNKKKLEKNLMWSSHILCSKVFMQLGVSILLVIHKEKWPV